jgi:hypothetical protein
MPERESRVSFVQTLFSPGFRSAVVWRPMRSATPNRGVRFKRSATFPGGSLETQIGNYSVLSRAFTRILSFLLLILNKLSASCTEASFGVRLP